MASLEAARVSPLSEAPMVLSKPRLLQRLESPLIFLLAGAVVVYVGLTAIGVHGLANWNGLSALAHAVDVLYREPMVNLALVGFAEPPATALLYLPLAALFPYLPRVDYVTCIFGALLLGWCALLLNGLGKRHKLAWWLRYLAIAVLVLHPVSVSYAALGSPIVLLLAASLGMASSLASWGEKRHLRDLIACSSYATIALLTRYEAIFLVIAAIGYIAATGLGPGVERWSRVEGLLITFLLPVVYFAGLWLVANWLIMGSQWHSLSIMFGTTGAPPQSWSSGVLVTALLACPFSYALAYHELRPPRPLGIGVGPALLLVAAIAGALLWPRLYIAAGDGDMVSWWSALGGMSAVVLATSLVLAVLVVGQYLQPSRDASSVSSRRPLAGTVLLAVAGIFIIAAMRPADMVIPAGPGAVFQGHVAFAHSAETERQVADLVAREVARGTRVVIAGWPGFAIALYAHVVGQVEVLPAHAPDLHVAEQLGTGDLLVLLGEKALWAGAMPHQVLAQEWTVGEWQGLRVTSPDAAPPTSNTP
jgi:hypothetical protein